MLCGVEKKNMKEMRYVVWCGEEEYEGHEVCCVVCNGTPPSHNGPIITVTATSFFFSVCSQYALLHFLNQTKPKKTKRIWISNSKKRTKPKHLSLPWSTGAQKLARLQMSAQWNPTVSSYVVHKSIGL